MTTRSAGPGIDRVVAVWPHAGTPADLVRALKYGRATSVVTELADAMAALAPAADLVTWIPAVPSRRRQRGFDQGELLGRAIARRLGLPSKRLLRRTDSIAQTARDRTGRLAGPSFQGIGRQLRSAPHVVVVDDVHTTGATLRAAAALLRARGAGEVTGLVATRADDPCRGLRPVDSASTIWTHTTTSGG